MTEQPGISSRDAGRRGRLREARPSRHAGDAGDGILVLVPSDPSRGADSSIPMPAAAALAQLRAEHDAALEQIAFLEEQLRGTVAYHTHLFERERARLLAEQQTLLHELAMLGDEPQHRAREDAPPADACSNCGGAAVAAGSASRQ